MVLKKISDRFLKNLLDSFFFVDLIKLYVVGIRPYGTNFFSLCPFHKEKTPSFFINNEKKVFFCFGCKVGGNSISFLMRYKNISFLDAVKTICIFTGVNYAPEEKASKIDVLYKILNKTSIYYSNNIFLKENKNYLKYILDRNFSIETIKFFNLGCVNEYWTNLFFYLKNFFSLQYCEELVLFKKSKNNTFFDFFRDMVIFPIKNSFGFVVGFGGRKVKFVKNIKYINSQDSVLFNKKKILYGLYECLLLSNNLESIIVVEGYFDVLRLVEVGVLNCVAVLGTCVTSWHILKIYSYVKNIFFCFDGDVPGKIACWETLKKVSVYLYVPRNVNFILLPFGYDPDKFILKQGSTKFLGRLTKSISFFSFFFSYITYKFKLLFSQTHKSFFLNTTNFINNIPNTRLKLEMINVLNVFMGAINKHKKVKYEIYLTQNKICVKNSLFKELIILLLFNKCFSFYIDSYFLLCFKKLIRKNIEYYFFFKLVCLLRSNTSEVISAIKKIFVTKKYSLDIFNDLYFTFKHTYMFNSRLTFFVLYEVLKKSVFF